MALPDLPSESPPVRYYPRRLARAGRRAPLSPSQALHLASAPARAAAAATTAERRHYIPPAPAPAVRTSRLRRWLHKLTGR